MSRFSPDSQKGIAQIALLLLLVIGLGAAVYGVQYARTVMNPHASEGSFADCTYQAEACDEETQTITRFSQSRDSDGLCENKVEKLDQSCAQVLCKGDNEYCDNSKGKVIQKTATKYIDGQCEYDTSTTNRTCAYSSEGANCEHKGTYCDPSTQRVTYVYSQKLPNGSCEPKTQLLDQTCGERFCPDNNFEYCDDVKFNPGKVIRKVNGRYQDGQCEYDYQTIESKTCADLGKPEKVTTDKTKINPTLRCNPGTRSSDLCAWCNSEGTNWNASGTDWGNYENDSAGWCACGANYSQKQEGKDFTSENYPQCVGVNI